MKRSIASKGGFTLLEIMLVVMIIALLAGSVMMMVGSEVEEARESTAKADVQSMKTSILRWNVKNGGYPTTEQGLQALVTARIMKEIPKDPWGEPYNYESPGKNNPDEYDLYSSGKDQKAGTSDDIGNWKKPSGP